MPVVAESDDLQQILRADVKSYNRHQRCYLRQLELTEAVKARERRQN